MHIIIAHSHLNHGGVTRIIELQVKSLPDDSVSVIVGSFSNQENITRLGAELSIFEYLNYLENRKYSNEEAGFLLNKILITWKFIYPLIRYFIFII